MPAYAVQWCGSLVFLLALARPPSLPPIPELALDGFPAVSRAQISAALKQARARPGDASSVGQLGMVLQAWEQWEAATAVYARAQALEPRYDWYYLAGVAESRLARHAEAAVLLRKAVALMPTLPAKLALADALFDSGVTDESARLYEALLREPAAEPHAHYGLGRTLAVNGQQEPALREFDAAIELYPEFGAAWYAKGMALRSLQRLDEAQSALARAQQLGTRWPAVDDPVLARVSALRDDGSAHLKRGLALERQGDLAGAIREHEAALALDPTLAQAHVNLISLYGRQGAWPQAESHYREAIRLGFSAPEAHYNYGVLLLLQHRETEAAAAFQLAIAANPQHAGAWNNLGLIAEHARRLPEALEDYRRAVEHAPADSTVRFNVARMLIATGQYTEAIPQLERLSAVEGTDRPRYMFGLATAWVLAGDVAKGRRYANDARGLAAAAGQTDLVAAIDRELEKLPQ